jgi:beta-lactamase class A
MSRWLLLILCFIAPLPLPATGVASDSDPAAIPRLGPAGGDSVLEAELTQLVARLGGRAGIYARRLGTEQEVSINADEVFPTASMIDIPLLVGLFAGLEDGRFQLLDEMSYDTSFATPGGADVLHKLRPAATVTLWRLAGLMITVGDHVAGHWIQQLVGGENVNEWLSANGFEHTRVNSRVEGREDAQEAYGWGQTTPRELSRLLVMIRHGEAINESASSDMYRLLSRNWWPFGAKSAVPPAVGVAAKAGGTSTTRGEIILVNAPAGDYVLCVVARATTDGVLEGGDALIRSVSAAVWERWGEPASSDPSELEVPGAVFRYLAEGQGPPIIAFTGSENIGHQLYSERLREAVTIIHADPSEIPASQVASVDMQTVLEDVERVRLALGLERISVMGHSMFAAVPLEYGLAYPQHAQWLILTGGLPYTTEEAFEAAAVYWDTAASQQRKDIRRANHDALARRQGQARTEAEQFWDRYVADVPYRFGDPRFDMDRFANSAAPTTNMAFVNHFWNSVLKNFDNTLAYSELVSPVLVVAGKFDFGAPHFLWTEVGQRITDYTFHLFEYAGHNPMLEVPEEFDNLLINWMKSRRP